MLAEAVFPGIVSFAINLDLFLWSVILSAILFLIIKRYKL